MLKIDPKDKHTHKIQTRSYVHIRKNISIIVGLLEGTRKRKKGKRMVERVNNTQIHCICVGRRHKETH
jgi:hypothetical protein